MNNTKLETARQLINEGNLQEGKLYFDSYLDELENQFDYNDTSYIAEVKNEYLQLLINVNNLNISEENSIYKLIDETKSRILEENDNGEDLTEYEDNTRKLMSYKLGYRVHWGNYAENEIIEIIHSDPKYVLWCILNLEHFAVDNSVFLFKGIRQEPDLIKALETNLIKKMIIEKWDEYYDSEYNDYYSYDDNDYRDYDRDNFDALTDGQLGRYEDFEGDIDDVMTWLGRD